MKCIQVEYNRHRFRKRKINVRERGEFVLCERGEGEDETGFASLCHRETKT